MAKKPQAATSGRLARTYDLAPLATSVSPNGSRLKNPVELPVRVAHQPDDTSCGPTCLQAVYAFHGLELSLDELRSTIQGTETGGTLAVHLGCDALNRGFECDLHTADLDLFDPTWFGIEPLALINKLEARRQFAIDPRAPGAIDAYQLFLRRGGRLHCAEFVPDMIRRPIRKGLPAIAGLSATYLYRTPRELDDTNDYDDVRGQPQGHFVVLAGYDPNTRRVTIADPLRDNPLTDGPYYHLPLERLISAVALGAWTYDANLLVISRPSPTTDRQRNKT